MGGSQEIEQALQRVIDRQEIEDALMRYTRGVDRGDWELVRSLYHADAYEDHVEFRGTVDEFIPWLQKRFANVEHGLHHLGNCQIEFAGPHLALVETYYQTQRIGSATTSEQLDAGASDRECWHSMGRYVDRFERRSGAWRVAKRTVVVDVRYTSRAHGVLRTGPGLWGRRDRQDRLYLARAEIIGSE